MALVLSILYIVALVVVVVAALVAIAALVARCSSYRLPKGHRPFTPVKIDRRPGDDATRDAFRVRKLPENIDFVIIGSGIGSLYCAALLAKLGMKVVVLEQHYVAGGCTHCFRDKNFEFDTGVHYVGRIEKYKTLLDLVSTGNKVKWAKIGTDEDSFCYDEIKLGADKLFRFCAGKEAFIENLVAEFPKERAAIEEWVRLCQRINKKADMYFFGKLFNPLIQNLVNKFLNREYFSWAKKSSWEVACSLTQNKRLRALLCGQFGNYGLDPKNSSFLIQAGITAHYMGGGYYPEGGSQEISKAIIPTIEAAGGRVFVKAKVQEIVVDARGHARGVRMVPTKKGDKGVLVLARRGVVSGTGAFTTNTLVPEAHRARLGYDSMLKKVGRSISHVYAFVGLKGTTEELGLRAANLWVLPVDDEYQYSAQALSRNDCNKYSAADSNPWEGLGEKDDTNDILLFMGFPSVKDPSFAERFPNKSTCQIISVAHFEWFQRFLKNQDTASTSRRANQSGKRRDVAYSALKHKLEQKLLRALYRHYPQCKGNVEYVEVGTPLTNLYYLNRADSYGLEHTPAHYAGALDKMRPETGIPGLFVTGQDVASVGFVGALNGGILAAHAILGYGFWDLVVAKRNLIDDLMTMDKNVTKNKDKST